MSIQRPQSTMDFIEIPKSRKLKKSKSLSNLKLSRDFDKIHQLQSGISSNYDKFQTAADIKQKGLTVRSKSLYDLSKSRPKNISAFQPSLHLIKEPLVIEKTDLHLTPRDMPSTPISKDNSSTFSNAHKKMTIERNSAEVSMRPSPLSESKTVNKHERQENRFFKKASSIIRSSFKKNWHSQKIHTAKDMKFDDNNNEPLRKIRPLSIQFHGNIDVAIDEDDFSMNIDYIFDNIPVSYTHLDVYKRQLL